MNDGKAEALDAVARTALNGPVLKCGLSGAPVHSLQEFSTSGHLSFARPFVSKACIWMELASRGRWQPVTFALFLLLLLPSSVEGSYAYRYDKHRNHSKGTWTSRGWDIYTSELQYAFPTTDLLVEVMGEPGETAGRAKAVLELGCGEAHALLDIQYLYPEVQATCMNSWRYSASCLSAGGLGSDHPCGDGPTVKPPGYTTENQTEVETEVWIKTAEAFGIPELPKWPHVTFAEFGERAHNKLPFKSSAYDLVIEQASFGPGKLNKPLSEFPQMVSEVARLLTVGGLAVLQVSLNENGAYEESLNFTKIAGMTKARQRLYVETPHQERERSKEMLSSRFPFARKGACAFGSTCMRM